MIGILGPDIAVSPTRARRVFEDAGQRTTHWWTHGPAGFQFALSAHDKLVGSVVVSQCDWDGEEWLHASIAFADRMPTYGELVLLKAAVFGPTRTAYQVFATTEQHVNIHEFALHLWGRADGKPVLPDFGRWGTI